MNRDEKWLLEEKYAGKETAAFELDRKRLAKGEPLPYVIGWQQFLGLKIYLDSKPLIPRPETEWWMEKLIRDTWSKRRNPPSEPHIFLLKNCSDSRRRAPYVPQSSFAVCSKLTFLDLCAGSGAIGCAALAALPSTRVYFGEIDPVHEATIRKNIHENTLDETRVDVRIGDLFEPFGGMMFDIIAANPPYIPEDRTLPESVIRYEPSLALAGGEDGLEIIRRIAAELPRRLNRGGMAWIECDSAHAAAACALFEANGLTSQIHTDQYDTPRLIVVHSMR